MSTKKRKHILTTYDPKKFYTLTEAMSLIKKMHYVKFDSSVDIDVRLGIDPRKSDQIVRGTVKLPHGTGKQKRVLVLCQEDKRKEAVNAGADHIGYEDYLEKIEKGWLDIDVIITEPALMSKLAKLGRVLGPKGLMPNPKSGTVTEQIAKAVQEIKQGKIDIKTDKYGIVHSTLGRISFSDSSLTENAKEFLQHIHRLKPSSVKGTYIRSVYLSSTMGPSVTLDKQELPI